MAAIYDACLAFFWSCACLREENRMGGVEVRRGEERRGEERRGEERREERSEV
jgi:hypothetical protein